MAVAGVTYTYDADGRRVQKSSGRAYWYGVGGEVLAESDLAGVIQSEYIFFGGKRIARRDGSGNTVFYYFSDHLGSASVVTNASGTIVEESDYYPFGGERIITNSDPNQYKFTGKERDGESGLDYFGARHYTSNLGRFLQPDEFSGGPVDAFSSNDPAPPKSLPYADITNPQSLNKYTYTWNNPLAYVDPDGHSLWSKIIRVFIKGGDVAGTLASAKADIQKALDSKQPVMARVEAAGRAGSEFLPFSASDAEDAGQMLGEGLAKLDAAGGVAGVAASVKKGEFSVTDWSGFPEDVRKPEGTVQVVEGSEYQENRRAADNANQKMHRQQPELKGQEIHDVKPIKFGGNPIDPANKQPLSPAVHRQANSFWQKLLNAVKTVK